MAGVPRVGIDPGKEGGVAIVDELGHGWAEPIRMDGEHVDVVWLTEICKGAALVVVEKQQALPARMRGGVASFSAGFQYGAIVATLTLARIPFQTVSPQAWKKKVLAGTAKDKAAAVTFVKRKYPMVDLTPGRNTVPHDGMADAVCLADYALGTSK